MTRFIADLRQRVGQGFAFVLWLCKLTINAVLVAAFLGAYIKVLVLCFVFGWNLI